MILEFSVTNFLSFKNRTTFSMTADNTSGLDNNYTVINNRKIFKTVAIYGANASGKTNLFEAIFSLCHILKKSNEIDVNEELLVAPFKFDDKTINSPSEFEIKFIVKNIRYVYGLVVDRKKIYEEYLYYYPNGREAKIFDRTNVDEYSFPQADKKVLEDIASKNASNKSFLATATNWNYEKTREPYNFLSKYIYIFNGLDELKNVASKIYKNDNGNLKKFALDYLKKADFNIVDFDVHEIEVSNFDNNNRTSKIYNVLFKHKGSNNLLSLIEESLGTQMIYSFIPFIKDALENSKVIIVDELDRSLHPYLVEFIVEMFNDSESDTQLIFNTHDTNLLKGNILRRDQIWFTDKNNKTGESELYTLSDFNARKNDNFEKGYLLGKYGGVPNIKNDIKLWEED